MYKVFKRLIHQRSALDYVDVILLLSNSKLRILQLLKQLHDFVERRKLDLAPKKLFSCFSLYTISVMKLATKKEAVQSKIAPIKKFPSQTDEVFCFNEPLF